MIILIIFFLFDACTGKIRREGQKILKENDPRKQSRINVHSVFWMVAGMCVFYYSDFYIAIKVDDRIHR